MADITLAQFGGTAWLVQGEQHIDELLSNRLAPEISIEIRACDSQSEVYMLWQAFCDPAEIGDMPWAIHPAVFARIRGAQEGFCVTFAPWSAQVSADAEQTLMLAAGTAQGRKLVLVLPGEPAASGMEADLTRLRAALLERGLAAAGAAPENITRSFDPAAPPDQISIQNSHP